MLRLRQRKGFTLIELLIVIVIIGILAAIAIPKFGKTREKAFFKAMQSDLRNLMSQQELYFSVPTNNYSYAPAITNLPDFVPSAGVTVAVNGGAATGWNASASHAGLLGTQTCGVFVGDPATWLSGGAPALTPGIVACNE
jgi:type IV pilus assembly protein PilA